MVTAEPPFTPFAVKTIDCMHQTGPRKGVYHPALRCPIFDVHQVYHNVGHCVKMEVVFVKSAVTVRGHWTVLLGYSANVRNIKSAVDNSLSFIKPRHRCILHSTQCAKLSTFFLLSSPELSSTDYKT